MNKKRSAKKTADPLATLMELLRDKGVFQPHEKSPKDLAGLIEALVQKDRINSFDAEDITGGRGRGKHKALRNLLADAGILDDEDLRLF